MPANTASPNGDPCAMPDANYLAARILAPFDPSDPAYVKEITVTTGRNRTSMNWQPQKMPVIDFIRMIVEKHREGSKDGRAFVLGHIPRGRRLMDRVISMSGVVGDIDNGTPSEVVDAKLQESGLLCIRYTTHSHMRPHSSFAEKALLSFAAGRAVEGDVIRDYAVAIKKWTVEVADSICNIERTQEKEDGAVVYGFDHAPMPKHRVVFFLEVPFVIVNEGQTQVAALRKWRELPKALGCKLGLTFDESCIDAQTLFFFPRHDKGKPFEMAVSGGRYLDWRSLDSVRPAAATGFEKAVGDYARHGTSESKSITPEGRALGPWCAKQGDGFMVADVIRDQVPDKIRNDKGAILEIECPFEHDHSTKGGTACIAINAQDGSSPVFTVKCHHNGCQRYTCLDMLAKMLADKWFDPAVLHDPQYDALKREGDRPALTAAEITERVKALTTESTEEDVRALIKAMVDSGLAVDSCRVNVNLIFKQTGGDRSIFGKKLLKSFLDVALAERRAREPAAANSNSTSDKIAAELSESLGRKFEFPPARLGNFYLTYAEGKPYLFRKEKSGTDTEVGTPYVLRGGVKYPESDHGRALRVDVLNAEGKWVAIDITSGELSMSGADAITKMRKAGWAGGEDGKKFIVEHLSRVQPLGLTVYHRGGPKDINGVRNAAFVCLTGEVLLTDEPIELAPEAKLECAARAGSFEGWREGVKGIFELPLEKAYHFQAGVLLGFVGTLATYLDGDTLFYNIEGKTGWGKTTLQKLAVASHCEPTLKKQSQIMPASGTGNVQEARMEKVTGTVLAFDEFAKGVPIEEQTKIIFMAQAGAGKGRLKRDAQERKTRTWKGGAVLTSAETGFTQRLRQAKITAEGGLAARMFPISMEHLTEQLTPDVVGEGGRIIEPGEYRKHVQKALDNFGWAGPEFIRKLDEHGYIKHDSTRGRPVRVGSRTGAPRTDALGRTIERVIRKLVGKKADDDSILDRAARFPAYIWAAGLLAQSFGFIPRQEFGTRDGKVELLSRGYDVEALARLLWKHALENESGPRDVNAAGLETLISSIISRRDFDIYPIPDMAEEHKLKRTRPAVGYYDDTEKEYIIHSRELCALAGGAVIHKSFLAYLDKLGYLVKEKGKTERTRGYYPNVGKTQLVVLAMDKIDSAGVLPEIPATTVIATPTTSTPKTFPPTTPKQKRSRFS